MRLEELFEQILFEDPDIDSADKSGAIPVATIVPAHIFEMKGLPIPLNSEKKMDANFLTPQKVKVGYGEGMVTPEQVAELNQWYEAGSPPGGVGADYNSNWLITDMAYSFVDGLDQFIEDGLKGQAIQIDGALKRHVRLNAVLKTLGLKTFDDASKFTTIDVVNSIYDTRDDVYDFFAGQVDKDNDGLDDETKTPMGFPSFERFADDHYRDQKDITAGAVSSYSDLATLFSGGKAWTDVRWQGIAGMLASELPSDLINWGATVLAAAGGTAVAGPGGGAVAGFAANSHLSTIEAMGAASQEIDQQVQQLYNEGILQKTEQWKNALEITGGDESAAVRYVQKSTYAANALRATFGDQEINLTTMQAIGLTAGTLDAIVDKLVFGGKVPIPGLRNFVAKAVVAGITEGTDEGLQQLFKNRGLIDGAGAPITETDGIINAVWQGSVLGTSRSGAGSVITGASNVARVSKEVVQAFGSSGKKLRAGAARLREFYFGRQNHDGSPEAFDSIIRILRDSPELARISNYMTDENGELDLDKFINQDMPSFEDLTRAQQQGKGTIDLGNGNVVDAAVGVRAVRANDYAKKYFPVLKNSIYNVDKNEYQSTFKNEQEALRAAQLLGFEKGREGSNDGFDAVKNADEVIEYLEKIVGYDVRVSGRTEFESPNFNTMTAQQRSDFFKLGKVKAGRFTFSREDIIKQSLEDNVGVPSNVLSFVEQDSKPVDARPSFTDRVGDDNSLIKAHVDTIRSLETQAYREMNEDKQFWIEEFGKTHNEDGSPKDPNAEGVAGRQLTDDDTGIDGSNGAIPSKEMDYYKKKANLDNNIYYRDAQKGLAEAKKRLAIEQKKWDLEFGNTHTKDGKVKIQGEMLNHVYAKYDDKILRDQKVKNKEEAETVLNNELMKNAKVINDPPKNTDVKRGYIVYNAMLKIANGDMDVEVAKQTLSKLEETYPGISNEIMKGFQTDNGDPDWDRYDQFQQALKSKPPEIPQIEVIQPGKIRQIGTERFAWKGAQWVSLDSGRMATKEQQPKLFTPQEAGQVPYVDTGTYSDPIKFEPSDFEVKGLPGSGTENITSNIDIPGADKEITIPDIETLGDPSPSGTLPNLDTSTGTTDQEGGVGGTDGEVSDVTPADATQQGGRGTPETPAQSAERVAAYKRRQAELKAEKEREEAERQAKIISDLEAEADAAAAEEKARRDAEREKTPDLRIGGANFEVPGPEDAETNRTNKEKIPGQTTGDGPVKFVPQSKLTKDQKDAIAGRGKYKVDKGDEVKDKDPSKAGIQTDEPDGTKQDDSLKGYNKDELDMIKKDGDNIEANLARQQRLQNELKAKQQQGQTGTKGDANIAGLVTPNLRNKIDTQKNTELDGKKKNQKAKLRPTVKIPPFGTSSGDDSLSDLMKFYPAKYQDPLDLDKYKGGMAKARGTLSK